MELITKEQYKTILDQYEKYVNGYMKMFPNKPMSEDFAAGLQRGLDIVESVVKKD